MPAFPEVTEPLRDGEVAVRFGSERDIPEILIAHQDDPQLHVRLGEPRPPSGAELGRSAEREPAERTLGTGATLTILDGESDDCRGQIYVHHVDWEHQRAELGIWVSPALRGRGIARRALILAGRWLLHSCGMERVQILTDPDNQAMIRAAEAAGFVREGILREYLLERGQRVDVQVLSLLPEEVDAQ